MNKKESENLTLNMLIADAILRIKTLETLLVNKGIFTQEEFIQTMDDISKKIAKSILEKSNVKGNIDEIIDSLKVGIDN